MNSHRLLKSCCTAFALQSDPNFIKRLIGQLDKQMSGMVGEKKKKLEQIEKDQAEMDQIDAMIKSHIQPNVDQLNQSIKYKTELRDNLKKELELQTNNLKKMERDAAALISSIRTKATKLNVGATCPTTFICIACLHPFIQLHTEKHGQSTFGGEEGLLNNHLNHRIAKSGEERNHDPKLIN